MIDTPRCQEAWASLKDKPLMKPVQVAAILGSGWGDVIDRMEVIAECSYADIPGFGNTGVVGHAGRLVRVRMDQTEALVFQGRRHFYEGEGWTPVALPIYLMKKAGVQNVLLTNAAGGIREDLSPGDLMILTDHIFNFPDHPLKGPHDPFWGERFPDQSHVYDPVLGSRLKASAQTLDIPIAEGVYLASSGPTYETPAEVRAYQQWGADAVGMSTAPEAMLANAVGLRVAGLSCISNYAAGIIDQPLTHKEVTETAQNVMPQMEILLTHFLPRALSA